jgi:uncharacterized radical SAM protein YgiQ
MVKWLPITKKEVEQRGWDELDVIIVSGDAYVDHPSFGAAVIGRIIERQGFRVALVPQPNWRDDLRDFKKLGKPRLFFSVTSGCMDSMINHYTANKRLRSSDAYTPGGKTGFRPDHAVVVYTKILKKLYPEVPVIIGGIEASLRRVTHYDYWQDQLKPSILAESGADILVYGMAEQPLSQLLKLLDKNIPVSSLITIPQTAVLLAEGRSIPKNKNWETYKLASHEACLKNKQTFAENFKHIEQESNKRSASRLIQKIGKRTLAVNPPFPTMSEKEIDASFDLPYTRLPHPKYQKRGVIPAYEMIKHSITLHRGCFGGCSFCTLSAHQGKMIASRSKQSILKEVEAVTQMEDFRGYISDLGGPTANMYKMKGKDQSICDKCQSPSCIFPSICNNLNINHKPLLKIYKEAAAHPKVKKVFVSSGIRYDLLVGVTEHEDRRNGCSKYIEQVAHKHVSGRLKVAPEHTSDAVLKIMRKPSFRLFQEFKKRFDKICRTAGSNQQLIPYFISSHPGCSLEDMADLAVKTKDMGLKLEQVQDFTPTPMTVSAVIYYSGYHPYTLKPVYTAKSKGDKLSQRRFFFWYKKENKDWIKKTLKNLKRKELVHKLFG